MAHAAQSPAPGLEDWSGELGDRWLANLDRFESMIAPAGEALMARAAFSPGERVVDIGCGGGATSLAIAGAVGPGGEVVGVDVSAGLVAEAQRRAEAAGIANASFVCADAGADIPPGAPFDRLFSRFGSMFFPDAAAGFRNLHAMLKPGARLDLAVWAPAAENPWLARMGAIVRGHLDMEPPAPRSPGGFAFDDPDYMRQVLADGGFRDADIVGWTGVQHVGGAGATPQEAAAFVTQAMAFADRLAAKGPDVVAGVRGELEALFAEHHRPGEGIGMAAKAWLVRATA